MNALQLCRWQFSHKETKLSAILRRKKLFAFLSAPSGSLGQRKMITLSSLEST